MPNGTFRHVRCHGLLGTYDDARGWLCRAEIAGRSKCIVSLGSSISNLPRADAAGFLFGFGCASVYQKQSEGLESSVGSSMLIGLDACTDEKKISEAYKDAQGLSAQFILNAIDHANAVLGYSAFDKLDWRVYGEWDKLTGSQYQYLVPQKNIEFEGLSITAGKKLLVIQSHKYTPMEQAQLWNSAGLLEFGCWTNEDESYGK